jgi:hypothetical protein
MGVFCHIGDLTPVAILLQAETLSFFFAGAFVCARQAMSRIPRNQLMEPVSGRVSKEQLRQRIQKDLSGLWLGNNGETYQIHFVSTTDSWTCVRRNTNGMTHFSLRWNGGDSIAWGSTYKLKLSDLQKNPFRLTWTSDFGKRPFVWERFHEHRLAEKVITAVAAAVDQPHVVRMEEAPSISAAVRTPPAKDPPAAAACERPQAKGVAAAKFAKLSRGVAAVAAVVCPTVSRKPLPVVVVETLDETGAGAAAALKMLRRLQAQETVPFEFQSEVVQYVAEPPVVFSSKASKTRWPPPPAEELPSSSFSQVATPRSTALLELLSRRPPPPRMSPAEAELIEVVDLPPCAGCRVQAFFDNDWHFATVRQLLNDGRFEVLWESERSCSVLAQAELRRIR